MKKWIIIGIVVAVLAVLWIVYKKMYAGKGGGVQQLVQAAGDAAATVGAGAATT